MCRLRALEALPPLSLSLSEPAELILLLRRALWALWAPRATWVTLMEPWSSRGRAKVLRKSCPVPVHPVLSTMPLPCRLKTGCGFSLDFDTVTVRHRPGSHMIHMSHVGQISQACSGLQCHRKKRGPWGPSTNLDNKIEWNSCSWCSLEHFGTKKRPWSKTW